MNLFGFTTHASAVKTVFAVLFVLAGGTVAPAKPANAEEVELISYTDMQGAERIDLSARIWAISQRVAAAGCYIQNGIEAEAFKTIATGSLTEFSAIIAALEKGDPNLGILHPEKSRKILAGIQDVNLQWTPFNAAAMQGIDGSAPDEGWAFVEQQNVKLMDASKFLVEELVTIYASPPELIESYALTLEISARQMNLSQQMAKEICGINSGNTVLGENERLATSVRYFDTSLNALLNGMDAAGIIPPPTPEIKAALEQATSDWQAVKADIEKVTGPDSVDATLSVDIFKQLDAIYEIFNDISLHYVKASKAKI